MPEEPRTVDFAKREKWLRKSTLGLGVATPASVFLSALLPAELWPKGVTLLLAALTAVSGYLLWRAQEGAKERTLAEKDAAEAEARTLEELLQGEQARTRAAISGMFLPTMATLQKLASSELDVRRKEISGFRDNIVERSCQFVQAEDPRAAYFRIDDITAPQRRMTPHPVTAAPGRTDQFTTEFREGSGVDEDVWELIDSDAQAILRLRDPDAKRIYGTYISAPVRAGGITFGMLTINVREKGGLSEDDRLAMVVLARLLAAGEALCLSTHERNEIRRKSEARSTIPVGGTA